VVSTSEAHRVANPQLGWHGEEVGDSHGERSLAPHLKGWSNSPGFQNSLGPQQNFLSHQHESQSIVYLPQTEGDRGNGP
jgi:hypothetical protein